MPCGCNAGGICPCTRDKYGRWWRDSAMTKLWSNIECDGTCGDCLPCLREAQERHLRLVERMTTESVTQAEAAELRGQIAALIAEVGTLRGKLRDAEEALDWQAMNED